MHGRNGSPLGIMAFAENHRSADALGLRRQLERPPVNRAYGHGMRRVSCSLLQKNPHGTLAFYCRLSRANAQLVAANLPRTMAPGSHDGLPDGPWPVYQAALSLALLGRQFRGTDTVFHTRSGFVPGEGQWAVCATNLTPRPTGQGGELLLAVLAGRVERCNLLHVVVRQRLLEGVVRVVGGRGPQAVLPPAVEEVKRLRGDTVRTRREPATAESGVGEGGLHDRVTGG